MGVGILRPDSDASRKSQQRPLVVYLCRKCWGNGCHFCDNKGWFPDSENHWVARCEICNESIPFPATNPDYCSEDCRRHRVQK